MSIHSNTLHVLHKSFYNSFLAQSQMCNTVCPWMVYDPNLLPLWAIRMSFCSNALVIFCYDAKFDLSFWYPHPKNLSLSTDGLHLLDELIAQNDMMYYRHVNRYSKFSDLPLWSSNHMTTCANSFGEENDSTRGQLICNVGFIMQQILITKSTEWVTTN